MINRFSIVLATGFLGLLRMWGCGENAPQEQEHAPRTDAPLIAMLNAVKASDLNGFRNAYSKRIRSDAKQDDWENNLKEARGNLKRMYGDYKLEEFAFAFTGDEERGKVSMSHKGKKPIVLAIVKEDGQWKIDVR